MRLCLARFSAADRPIIVIASGVQHTLGVFTLSFHPYVCAAMHNSQSILGSNQTCMTANPCRGQLSRENGFPSLPRSRETGSLASARVNPLIPQTQADSGTYSRSHVIPSAFHAEVVSTPPLNDVVGSVPCLSGHAIAYRWRSPPRIRRHRASGSQGSSSNFEVRHNFPMSGLKVNYPWATQSRDDWIA